MKRTIALSLAALFVACTYEDHPYETKQGSAFPFWHVKCLAVGASEAQVVNTLGQPIAKKQTGGALQWRYWQVRQRKSIDRVLGIIPVTFHDDPEQIEAIVTLVNGRVSSIRYQGPASGCDTTHDNEGNLVHATNRRKPSATNRVALALTQP